MYMYQDSVYVIGYIQSVLINSATVAYMSSIDVCTYVLNLKFDSELV